MSNLYRLLWGWVMGWNMNWVIGYGGVRGGVGVGEVGRLEGLSCSVGDAWSMLSHMCSSWYFPKFLFRIGSLTHMNMASLMVLGMTMLYFLVYKIEIVRVQWMTCRCAVDEDWGRGLEMFFNPFPQCPTWFPYVSLYLNSDANSYKVMGINLKSK